MPRSVLVSLALTAALVLAACGSSRAGADAPASRPTRHPSPHPTHATHRPARHPADGARHLAKHVTKVLVVIEENHSLAEMRSGMPFLARLSREYGYATDWHALRHPSEPNYLGIAGGSTFGVSNDHPPAKNAARVGTARSVFAQAAAAGKRAATYAQSMPRRCDTADAYPYAVRHNPWTFFSADRAACRRHDRSTAGFARAARKDRLPNVGFLIPDMRHDAHDGTLGAADAWLHASLKPVLASHDFSSGSLVVVVTADEDDRKSGNVVLTSVLTPRLHHAVVGQRLTHYSLTGFIARVLGVSALRSGAHAPDLAAAFGL
ncbi:MAG TPA: alkaline phosphatase family protein [Nocardioides sp.]|jgi:acid phosphatase|uniref:alkaline phosphatase family protein n=1 Tax=Nocardioides sp. TaxID=35761 RepID=UPI002E303EDB|nr:alkaline phosphatase family protein [Nocardioides sp.]HEX3929968.1 alkaline phosphatase family protein [Nocardioides sp.]